MSYKVIHYFTDLQDNGFEYKVGDLFPRLGKNVDNARLKELTSTENRQGKALIELVEDKIVKNEVDQKRNEDLYTKTEINRMSTETLREVAKENGISNANEITGSELKKLLIAKFNL